jgi:hypothetical protein
VHKGEEWSAQRPLDRSREGEMGGRRKQGPATACGHAAIRRGGGGVRHGYALEQGPGGQKLPAPVKASDGRSKIGVRGGHLVQEKS